MVQSLPKHVEAADYFSWPEPPAGAKGGVRTDGHKVKYDDDAEVTGSSAPAGDNGDGGKKSKKTKKSKKKKKKTKVQSDP